MAVLNHAAFYLRVVAEIVRAVWLALNLFGKFVADFIVGDWEDIWRPALAFFVAILGVFFIANHVGGRRIVDHVRRAWIFHHACAGAEILAKEVLNEGLTLVGGLAAILQIGCILKSYPRVRLFPHIPRDEIVLLHKDFDAGAPYLRGVNPR